LEWVIPPRPAGEATRFTGLRLTVEGELTFHHAQPAVLFVWQGCGRVNDHPIVGGEGQSMDGDEWFLGIEACQRGLKFQNDGDRPLVAFLLFAEPC